jgi:hypothetical protein
LADGIVPRELVYSCRHFHREMRGLTVPRGIYVSICGTDLVQLLDGSFAVLEDNLRVPSGVSYRVAIGRDYADVPPTRGVYKGDAESELSVAVTVSPSDAPVPQPAPPSIVIQSRPMFVPRNTRSEHEQQQQQ